ESNTDDHDEEGQARSGGFDLNYCAQSKKCDEVQNKPIEGCWHGLSSNSSPCSRHSKCSTIFTAFSKALATSQYLLRFAAPRYRLAISRAGISAIQRTPRRRATKEQTRTLGRVQQQQYQGTRHAWRFLQNSRGKMPESLLSRNRHRFRRPNI